MKRLFFTLGLLCFAAFSVSAQFRISSSDTMMKRCSENRAFYSSMVLKDSGDIMFTSCPDKGSIFNNVLQIRKNSADTYPSALSLDILNEFMTTESYARNVGFDFNVNDTPFSYSSSYTNASFNTRYNSPNRAGAVLGMFSNATLMSEASVHDIQGIHGEALAVRGTAASGLYGGVFNVGLFGGTNHGNIADLTVGASTVRDTDVRNYYRLWIKKPTILNATIRDGKNYSIYQEGQFGSEFQGYLFLNNAHANSSGANVSPFQIKLANAQTAEAFTVKDSNDMPLFSLSSEGQLRVAKPMTPASSSDTCSVGRIVWDANNIYVCIADNNWKKSQLNSW